MSQSLSTLRKFFSIHEHMKHNPEAHLFIIVMIEQSELSLFWGVGSHPSHSAFFFFITMPRCTSEEDGLQRPCRDANNQAHVFRPDSSCSQPTLPFTASSSSTLCVSCNQTDCQVPGEKQQSHSPQARRQWWRTGDKVGIKVSTLQLQCFLSSAAAEQSEAPFLKNSNHRLRSHLPSSQLPRVSSP